MKSSQAQEFAFKPIIDHIEASYSIKLNECTHFCVPGLSQDSHANVLKLVESLEDIELIAFEAAASSVKSGGIAVSFIDNFIDIAYAMHAARLEESLRDPSPAPDLLIDINLFAAKLLVHLRQVK